MPQPEACASWDADLSALIDGELEAGRERAVREHVEGCERCGARLASLRRVDGLLASPLPRVDPAVRDAVLRRAAPPPRARGPRRRTLGWLGAPLAAAAALALYLALRPAPQGPLDPVAPPLAERSDEQDTGPIEQPSTLIAEPMPPPAMPPPPEPEIPRFELELEPPGELLADAAEPAPRDAPELVAGLEAEPTEDLAIVLLGAEEPDDIDVIANLEILERLIALEGGRG